MPSSASIKSFPGCPFPVPSPDLHLTDWYKPQLQVTGTGSWPVWRLALLCAECGVLTLDYEYCTGLKGLESGELACIEDSLTLL